jgi:hypothetical protein
VYGAVPPLTPTVALPVLFPKQSTSICASRFALSPAAGCVIVAVRVTLQPFASVMVQVQVPAERPVADAVFCTGVVFQTKVYGAVPPEAFIVAVPVLLPKQSTLVCALSAADNAAAGCEMDTLRSMVQPFASVIVHAQFPADRLEAVAEFWTGVVFQL